MKDALNDAWETLRGLLAQDMGRGYGASWERLLACLERWPDPGSLELALEYAAHHLQRWPPGSLRCDLEERTLLKPWCGLIRSVKVRHLPTFLTCLGAPERWGFVRKLHTLAFEASCDPSGVREAIDQASRLAFLVELIVSQPRQSDETMRAVALSSQLAGLRFLSMHGCQLTSGGVSALAEGPGLLSLERLLLSSNALDARACRVLGQSAQLVSLKALSLDRNPVGDEGARELARATQLPRLTSLGLANAQIGLEGLRALAESAALAGLTSLDLARNTFGVEGVRVLAQSPALAGLTSLRLSWNGVDDEGALALAASPHLAKLASLELAPCQISARGALALAESPHLSEQVRMAWRRS